MTTNNIDREPLLHRGGGGGGGSSSRRRPGTHAPPRHAFFHNSNNSINSGSNRSPPDQPHRLDNQHHHHHQQQHAGAFLDDSSYQFLGDVMGMETEDHSQHYHHQHYHHHHDEQQEGTTTTAPTNVETERDLQLVVLRILGRPYLRDWNFWWPTLFISIVLGIVLALSALMFVGSVHYLLSLWFHPDHANGTNGQGVSPFFRYNNNDWHASWTWPIYTALGGLVTGGIFYLSGIPVGAVRPFFHDMVDLQGRPYETPLVLATCWIGLALGSPLGPEMALGAMASGLATYLATTACFQQRNIDSNNRIRASWVQMAMAGSIGGLFPSPILAVLLVHELVVTGRPHAIPWDSLIRSSSPQQQPSQQQHARRNSGLVDHDLMEQVTLMGICALTAGVVVRGLVQRVLKKDLDFSISLGPSTEYREWHLLAAIPLGLLCGVMTSVGLIVTAISRTIRTRVTQRFQMQQQQQSQQQQQPESQQEAQQQQSHGDLLSLLFPTLAGLINGLCATYVTPYVIGSGVDVMRDLLEQAIHPNNHNHTTVSTWLWSEESSNTTMTSSLSNSSSSISPQSYLLLALTKLIVFSLSLGFGMVGGPVIPSLFVGLCLGLAMASAGASAWPLSLTVPCCMAATAGSMVPAPFSLVGTVAVLFQLSPTQMGPVFVATIVAFGVTGGLGILRRVGERRLSGDGGGGSDTTAAAASTTAALESNHHPLNEDGDNEESEIYVSPLPVSDEELVRGIRSAIFGK